MGILSGFVGIIDDLADRLQTLPSVWYSADKTDGKKLLGKVTKLCGGEQKF